MRSGRDNFSRELHTRKICLRTREANRIEQTTCPRAPEEVKSGTTITASLARRRATNLDRRRRFWKGDYTELEDSGLRANATTARSAIQAETSLAIQPTERLASLRRLGNE